MMSQSRAAPETLKVPTAVAKSMELSSSAEPIVSATATRVWRPGFTTASCTFPRRTRNNSDSIPKGCSGRLTDERKTGRIEDETSAALTGKVENLRDCCRAILGQLLI